MGLLIKGARHPKKVPPGKKSDGFLSKLLSSCLLLSLRLNLLWPCAKLGSVQVAFPSSAPGNFRRAKEMTYTLRSLSAG